MKRYTLGRRVTLGHLGHTSRYSERAFVPNSVVFGWLSDLKQHYGTQGKVAHELTNQFGGVARSWERTLSAINTNPDGNCIAPTAEKIWLLLTHIRPSVNQDWEEEISYKQPTWRVSYVDKRGRPVAAYYHTKFWARRLVEQARKEGALIEIARTDGPWKVINHIP